MTDQRMPRIRHCFQKGATTLDWGARGWITLPLGFEPVGTNYSSGSEGFAVQKGRFLPLTAIKCTSEKKGFSLFDRSPPTRVSTRL